MVNERGDVKGYLRVAVQAILGKNLGGTQVLQNLIFYPLFLYSSCWVGLIAFKGVSPCAFVHKAR